jgi:hypothetical protein
VQRCFARIGDGEREATATEQRRGRMVRKKKKMMMRRRRRRRKMTGTWRWNWRKTDAGTASIDRWPGQTDRERQIEFRVLCVVCVCVQLECNNFLFISGSVRQWQ